MKRISLLIILFFMLSLTISACQGGPTPVAPLEQEDLQTLVAGTLTAAAVEIGQTMTAAVTVTATVAPTLTETATLPPTDTPTVEVVTLTLSGNTNCRKGASTYFPVIVTYPAGAVVEVLARNPANDYFYVRAAESESGGCWIWKEFTSFTGNLESLVVYTPVPTPLPTATNTPPPGANFNAQFVGLTSCGSGVAANFNITNTGFYTLQSVRIKNSVAGTAGALTHTSNSFSQWSGGAKYATLGEIAGGKSMIVTTCEPGGFTSSPSGKEVTAEITICLKDDLAGACKTQNVVYKPD
jgi:hypothetical protein